jgi:hypothetical protein
VTLTDDAGRPSPHRFGRDGDPTPNATPGRMPAAIAPATWFPHVDLVS